MLQRGLTLPFAAALLLTTTLALAACGDDEKKPADTDTPAATTPAAGIDISGVPELEDGKMTIGSDIAYAPIEFYEEGTQNEAGLDIDLARAIADALGVEVEFKQVADFGGIVGDLTAKRYDVIMSAISITEEREAEIDLIPYFGPAGTGALVQTGNPEGIKTIKDLCGKAVAAQSGTFQVEQVEDTINKDQCKDDPIDLRVFPDNPSAVQELILGRVVAELADDPVVAYSASQSEGKVELGFFGFDSAPYGIGVRTDSPELRAALEAALAQIMTDGTYAKILADWGQETFSFEQ